jgi:hypothetical protein
MKRKLLLPIAAMMALTAQVDAQEMVGVKTINVEKLRKKIAQSDADIQNPKKMDNPKTWLERGNDFQEWFCESTEELRPGQTLRIMVTTKPVNVRQEQIGSDAYEVLEFPNVNLYFANGMLAFWENTNLPEPQLLFMAQKAYERAIELDAQAKLSKKLREALIKLSDKMRQEGLNRYTLKDNKGAQQYFMAAAECKLNPAAGVVDSVMLFYSGVLSASDEVADLDNAIKYLNLCIKHQYYENGNVYNMLAAVYAQKKDSIEQKRLLTEGFNKFPLNQEILIGLINYYLTSNNDPSNIIDLLKKAQEGDPKNASLYFVEGTLYEKLGKPQEAKQMYRKSTEIDPKYYNGYYNIGTLHYNKAVEYINESTTIKDWKSPRIKELESMANEEYKLALAEFLRAYEVDPKEKAALETIKNIYFRFREESPEMNKLYEEYKAKWDAMN